MLQYRIVNQSILISYEIIFIFSFIAETAMLLPGKYASKHLRSGKQKYDVRSNLKSYRQREGKQ